MCGTATKVNYLKEGLIYSRARHTLNPVQTGLRLQYSTCWSTLAQRQIQIGLPYLLRWAGTEVWGISSPLRLFPAGSADELIKAMISRKRPLGLNKGQSSAAAQSFCLRSHICPKCHKASCRRRGKSERDTHACTHLVGEGGREGVVTTLLWAIINITRDQEFKLQQWNTQSTTLHL